ncbi:MAG: phospholipase D-like domain-containing protein [Bacteroidota bacterium]|jgi:HKD family nuclease
MKTINKFLTIAVLFGVSIQSKSQTIATVRGAALNSTVTVKGIVTNGSELGSIRYVQDATAGIAIYGTNLTSVQRGDSIIATGTLTNYNNLLEVTPVSSFTVVNSGNPLPPFLDLTSGVMDETNESELAEYNICTITGGGGNFASNTNYNFTCNSQTVQLRINAASPLVGTPIPTGAVNIFGICSQFCSTPATGCTSGYQILPRDLADIVPLSSIYLTNQPYPSAISTSGLTVNWNTNTAGSFYIKYGKTPSLELGTINGSGTSATPAVAITGATPATIYYAQVFSINGIDTATSGVKVFCTASLSSGNIKVYFNKSVDNSVSTGTNAVYNAAIWDTLKGYIDRAQHTIDIAIYNWDNNTGGTVITSALNAAFNRGVKIRIIYDGSSLNSGLQTINQGIKIFPSTQGANYTIMHNKFVVIDANGWPNEPIVWTGSMNWTSGQLTTDPNNVIILQDQSLARGYKLEFDEMWGDTSVVSNGNTSTALFGKFKTDNTPHEYLIGGKRVESYFSPSDQTNSKILATIATANTDMYIGQMLITRSDLATKVATQKNTNSLTAKCIINDTANASGPYFTIRNSFGSSNVKLNPFSYIFHHKYLIVDQSNTASDPLVLTGSHNWSNNGDLRNDENTLIVHDASVANQYFQEFTKRWNEMNMVGISENKNDISFTMFPNPADNKVFVEFGSDVNKIDASIIDISGRVMRKFSSLQNIDGKFELGELNLPAGVYLVNINTGKELISTTLLISQED